MHYFGPGVHRPGRIRLESGETLYLAGGAFVYGTIEAENARNIRLAGRGVLCASHLEFGDGPGNPPEMVGLKRCEDVVLQGVTLMDSHCWTVAAYDCDHLTISRLKIINERVWSTDGINPCNSRDVEIADCFVRCKDDCVSVKGLEYAPRYDGRFWTPIENITVKRCVFWSDNNNALVVGAETRAEYIRNVRFSDCDLLKVSNTCGDIAGALSLICLDDTPIEGVHFEDIRIEYAAGPSSISSIPTSSLCSRVRGGRRAG